ncbi:hypothetical protein [Campylobacter geochelonis]|uniref:hypothetical protein n=1 Tax=Campylobacter geochelonis TaxID=1780362 RepID=UPI000770A23B|nr:hypothetical protein [Campylobacter geochelonis]CZE50570.1 Uncharacterised protein [Campylobacter geochelonis]
MKVFLDNKNQAISNIVATCCERVSCDLVEDYSYDLLIKECESLEDISGVDKDKTIFLLPRDIFTQVDVKNKILKPFLPTELIEFLKEFSDKFDKKEFINEKNLEDISSISNIVKEIDDMDLDELDELDESADLLDDEFEVEKQEEEHALDENSSIEELATSMSEDEIDKILNLDEEELDLDLQKDEDLDDIDKLLELSNEDDALNIEDISISEFAGIDDELKPVELAKLDDEEGKPQSDEGYEKIDNKEEPKEELAIESIDEFVEVEDDKEDKQGEISTIKECEKTKCDVEDELKDEIAKSIENALNSGKLKDVLKDMKLNISVSFEDKE